MNTDEYTQCLKRTEKFNELNDALKCANDALRELEDELADADKKTVADVRASTNDKADGAYAGNFLHVALGPGGLLELEDLVVFLIDKLKAKIKALEEEREQL